MCHHGAAAYLKGIIVILYPQSKTRTGVCSLLAKLITKRYQVLDERMIECMGCLE